MINKVVPLLGFVAGLGMISSSALAHDYEHHRGPDVPPVKNVQYQDECGSCHFAYQPGLLPAKSWQKLMGSLDNHFGENAELDAATRQQLVAYLKANSAEHSGTRRSARILRSAGKASPMRITDVRYIKRQHDEIPERLVHLNPDVRSLSNCAACHTRAESGSFAERDIIIPGIGRWDDD